MTRNDIAAAPARQLSATPRSLLIEWANGRTSEFSSVWLRDNCPGDRDRANGQRLAALLRRRLTEGSGK